MTIDDTDTTVDVEGRAVRISSLRRPLWPELGFTKRDLIDYYVRVAPVLLPHIAGRPITLHRFPEGVDGPHFFQTRCPPHPPWVRTQRMWTFTSGKAVDAPVIDDLAGLVWAANLATIELHPYLSKAESLDRPDALVFDLDPGAPAGLLEAVAIALVVRELVDATGLSSVVKVSGAKGVHIHVPIAGATFGETKAYARAVASLVARERPVEVVDRMTRSLRPGKVFIDWSQNDAGKSTVAPYSLRAGSHPTVAMPVPWSDLERALEAGDERALRFTPDDALAVVAQEGDRFSSLLEPAQRLPDRPRAPATPP